MTHEIINNVLNRKEAILLASFCQLFSLDEQSYSEISETVKIELEKDFVNDDKLNLHIREYLCNELDLVTNSYLEYVVSNALNINISIQGKEPILNACPCCGFKNLETRGEYSICGVCFWEDDGCNDEDKYSNCNHMTLKEAKRMFVLIGVIDEKYLSKMNDERFIKYKKDI